MIWHILLGTYGGSDVDYRSSYRLDLVKAEVYNAGQTRMDVVNGGPEEAMLQVGGVEVAQLVQPIERTEVV